MLHINALNIRLKCSFYVQSNKIRVVMMVWHNMSVIIICILLKLYFVKQVLMNIIYDDF